MLLFSKSNNIRLLETYNSQIEASVEAREK
jgi:hypothetical protein